MKYKILIEINGDILETEIEGESIEDVEKKILLDTSIIEYEEDEE